MSNINPEAVAHLRREILPRLIEEAHFTREEANEALDLALHAANEARRAAMDVCKRGSSVKVSVQSLVLAGTFMSGIGEQLSETMATIMQERGALIIKGEI